jgi:hypothetical protein
MTQARTLIRKVLWVAGRGAALGMSLAAVFPTQALRAECDCRDYGSGHYSCESGSSNKCVAGTEICDVTCS